MSQDVALGPGHSDVKSIAMASSRPLINTNGVPSALTPRCAMTRPDSSLVSVSVTVADARNSAASCVVIDFMVLGGFGWWMDYRMDRSMRREHVLASRAYIVTPVLAWVLPML